MVKGQKSRNHLFFNWKAENIWRHLFTIPRVSIRDNALISQPHPIISLPFNKNHTLFQAIRLLCSLIPGALISVCVYYKLRHETPYIWIGLIVGGFLHCVLYIYSSIQYSFMSHKLPSVERSFFPSIGAVCPPFLIFTTLDTMINVTVLTLWLYISTPQSERFLMIYAIIFSGFGFILSPLMMSLIFRATSSMDPSLVPFNPVPCSGNEEEEEANILMKERMDNIKELWGNDLFERYLPYSTINNNNVFNQLKEENHTLLTNENDDYIIEENSPCRTTSPTSAILSNSDSDRSNCSDSPAIAYFSSSKQAIGNAIVWPSSSKASVGLLRAQHAQIHKNRQPTSISYESNVHCDMGLSPLSAKHANDSQLLNMQAFTTDPTGEAPIDDGSSSSSSESRDDEISTIGSVINCSQHPAFLPLNFLSSDTQESSTWLQSRSMSTRNEAHNNNNNNDSNSNKRLSFSSSSSSPKRSPTHKFFHPNQDKLRATHQQTRWKRGCKSPSPPPLTDDPLAWKVSSTGLPVLQTEEVFLMKPSEEYETPQRNSFMPPSRTKKLKFGASEVDFQKNSTQSQIIAPPLSDCLIETGAVKSEASHFQTQGRFSSQQKRNLNTTPDDISVRRRKDEYWLYKPSGSGSVLFSKETMSPYPNAFEATAVINSLHTVISTAKTACNKSLTKILNLCPNRISFGFYPLLLVHLCMRAIGLGVECLPLALPIVTEQNLCFVFGMIQRYFRMVVLTVLSLYVGIANITEENGTRNFDVIVLSCCMMSTSLLLLANDIIRIFLSLDSRMLHYGATNFQSRLHKLVIRVSFGCQWKATNLRLRTMRKVRMNQMRMAERKETILSQQALRQASEQDQGKRAATSSGQPISADSSPVALRNLNRELKNHLPRSLNAAIEAVTNDEKITVHEHVDKGILNDEYGSHSNKITSRNIKEELKNAFCNGKQEQNLKLKVVPCRSLVDTSSPFQFHSKETNHIKDNCLSSKSSKLHDSMEIPPPSPKIHLGFSATTTPLRMTSQCTPPPMEIRCITGSPT